MAKQFLDRLDVIAVVQRVGGERMPQRVALAGLTIGAKKALFWPRLRGMQVAGIVMPLCSEGMQEG